MLRPTAHVVRVFPNKYFQFSRHGALLGVAEALCARETSSHIHKWGKSLSSPRGRVSEQCEGEQGVKGARKYTGTHQLAILAFTKAEDTGRTVPKINHRSVPGSRRHPEQRRRWIRHTPAKKAQWARGLNLATSLDPPGSVCPTVPFVTVAAPAPEGGERTDCVQPQIRALHPTAPCPFFSAQTDKARSKRSSLASAIH